MISILKDYYFKEIVPVYLQHGINKVAIPRLLKVVLSMGVGKSISNKDLLLRAVNDLTLIAGQKSVITKAKKSNASFKIRKDWEIGCMVTLRKKKMYSFLDRLLLIAIPCIQDFRGLSKKSFDGFGNYTLGIKEHIIFPEISCSKIDYILGLNITFVTNTNNDEKSFELFNLLKFPFLKY